MPLLDGYVNDGRIAGIVALVLRDGKPVYEHAVGWGDKEAGRKMTMDTVFRIASQSKALTSVAVLQLMEEGKLTVNDTAGKCIPTFAKTTVAVERERRRLDHRARQAAHHHPATCSPTPPASTTAPSREFAALYEAKGLGPAAGFGWYFADKDEPICDDHGAARHAALRRAAGRRLRLRLQHRHPRLHRREGFRHAAGRVHPRRTSPARSA